MYTTTSSRTINGIAYMYFVQTDPRGQFIMLQSTFEKYAQLFPQDPAIGGIRPDVLSRACQLAAEDSGSINLDGEEYFELKPQHFSAS